MIGIQANEVHDGVKTVLQVFYYRSSYRQHADKITYNLQEDIAQGKLHTKVTTGKPYILCDHSGSCRAYYGLGQSALSEHIEL